MHRVRYVEEALPPPPDNDRHERNWLVTTDAIRDDRWHLVLIDHAFSFNNLSPESDLHDPLPGRAAFTELHLSALQQRRLSPAQIRTEFRRSLANWRRAARALDLSWLQPDHAELVQDTIHTRMDHVAARERHYLEQLTDPGQRALVRAAAVEQTSELLDAFLSRSEPERSGPKPGSKQPPEPRGLGGGPRRSTPSEQPGQPSRGQSSPRAWRRQPERGRDGLER
jgi:hypothetical protein